MATRSPLLPAADETDVPADVAAVADNSPIVVDALAVVTGENLCVWRGEVPGKNLVVGEFELIFGEAILRMSGGSIVSVRSGSRFARHHATHLT